MSSVTVHHKPRRKPHGKLNNNLKLIIKYLKQNKKMFYSKEPSIETHTLNVER